MTLFGRAVVCICSSAPSNLSLSLYILGPMATEAWKAAVSGIQLMLHTAACDEPRSISYPPTRKNLPIPAPAPLLPRPRMARQGSGLSNGNGGWGHGGLAPLSLHRGTPPGSTDAPY
eukprot:scaffold83310_cov25-Tisochrysis_lutea.AAC.5